MSFPVAMTRWTLPVDVTGQWLPLADTLALKFAGVLPADGWTGATPLDAFRQFHADAARLAATPGLDGWLAGAGWEHVNLAFLAGGLWLLLRRVTSWHIPVAFLAALGGIATVAWLVDSQPQTWPNWTSIRRNSKPTQAAAGPTTRKRKRVRRWKEGCPVGRASR